MFHWFRLPPPRHAGPADATANVRATNVCRRSTDEGRPSRRNEWSIRIPLRGRNFRPRPRAVRPAAVAAEPVPPWSNRSTQPAFFPNPNVQRWFRCLCSWPASTLWHRENIRRKAAALSPSNGLPCPRHEDASFNEAARWRSASESWPHAACGDAMFRWPRNRQILNRPTSF